MKASRRDILLLIGVLGVLAAVCSYFLVYQPTMEKADLIEKENLELQARIADLGAKMQNKSTYIADTESMNREIDEVYKMFPVDVREEDGIQLAINQELIAPMVISSIGITACEPVLLDGEEEDIQHTYEIEEIEEYEAEAGISDDEQAVGDAVVNGSNTEDMPPVLMSRNVTINYLVSYDGLKRGVKNISAQDYRMSIDNLTVTYDEATGLLSGLTSVDMYCIPGQEGKEYVQPNFSSVLIGTDNIFGSIELYGGGAFGEGAEREEEAQEGEEGREEEE